MSTAVKTRKAKKVVGGDVVRAWARAQGIEVGTRGRLSDDLRDQFNKAKKGSMAYVGSFPETHLKVTLAA